MKRLLLLTTLVLLAFSTSMKGETFKTVLPDGIKNAVLYTYIGEANKDGKVKAGWVRVDERNQQCSDLSGNECLLWSWVVGDYRVKYSNPNDITQCYQELEEYIRINHPEDLDIDKACKNIKSGIEEANPSNPDAGKDVNPSTVTRTIKIISL